MFFVCFVLVMYKFCCFNLFEFRSICLVDFLVCLRHILHFSLCLIVSTVLVAFCVCVCVCEIIVNMKSWNDNVIIKDFKKLIPSCLHKNSLSNVRLW